MKQKTWCDQVKTKKYKVSRTTLKATWIDISDATTDDGGRDWHIRDKKCNNCGHVIRCYHDPIYCDVCGARMVKSGYYPQGEYVDISKLRLMTVEECAGHTVDYALGWKACIEWIKKGGVK